MYPFLKRMTLLSSALGLAILTGCDWRAESQVQQDVQASHELALHGTEESLSDARRRLDSAVASDDVSPQVQINARSLLAQMELESARAAQREIDRQMMDLSRLTADINQLGQQIATTNALVAGYRTYDPKQVLEELERNIADATGGPNGAAWFTHDGSDIPTLSVLRQEISRLEGEIAALEERLSELTAQRAQILGAADAAAREAEARTDRSLEAFGRASDLRKQAADLATDIENVEAALVPLRNDLSVAASQQAVIESFVEDLRQHSQALQGAWQSIQQQMAAQAALARAILQGAAGSPAAATVVPPGGSIESKATELSEIVAKLQTLREQAMENAAAAARNYEQCVSMALELRVDLSGRLNRNPQRPERLGWELLQQVLHPAVFQLQHAAAQRMVAEINSTYASELRTRIQLRDALRPIVQAANLAVPDRLDAPNLEQQRQQALRAADEAYQTADRELENVIEGGPENLQNAAYVVRTLTLYGWSGLSRDAGDSKAAAEKLAEARQLRTVAADRGIAMPTLPPGLIEPQRPTRPPQPQAQAPQPDEPAAPAADDAPAAVPEPDATDPDPTPEPEPAPGEQP